MRGCSSQGFRFEFRLFLCWASPYKLYSGFKRSLQVPPASGRIGFFGLVGHKAEYQALKNIRSLHDYMIATLAMNA